MSDGEAGRPAAATHPEAATEERWPAVTGELFVRWVCPEAPLASVVVLHGYSEHSERYGRVIQALLDAGFAVAAPDQRGHGRTGPRLGELPPGEALVADLLAVRDQVAARVPGRPVFVVANSMGGLVSLAAARERPAAFAGLVLQAPAIAMPADVSQAMLSLVKALGRWFPRLPVRPFFKPERATRDEGFQAWMARDPFTYKGWVQAGTARRSLALVEHVRAHAAEVGCPVLITHGTEDLRVLPRETEWLQGQLAGPVTRKLYEGLRHEAHQEPEGMDVVGDWVAWLTERAGTAQQEAS